MKNRPPVTTNETFVQHYCWATSRALRHFASISPLIAVLLLLGCDRSQQQAHDRVVDAVNPKVVSVSSTQCAVLRLPSGYAALVFTSVGQTSTFKVFLSQSGRFSSDQSAITEGSFRESRISVQGVPIHIGYDGQDASAVSLGWEDTQTGIALSPFASLAEISVSSLTFATNRGLNPNDLLKSIGQQK
jgi:hypothetical protein